MRGYGWGEEDEEDEEDEGGQVLLGLELGGL